MIKITSALGEGVVAVRFSGAVTNREFIDLAATIVDSGPAGSILMYLDWVGIDCWAFSVPAAAGASVWRVARNLVARAAIVHKPRLNRQAAWLAAFLREEGIQVRSWRPQNAVEAAVWLRAN